MQGVACVDTIGRGPFGLRPAPRRRPPRCGNLNESWLMIGDRLPQASPPRHQPLDRPRAMHVHLRLALLTCALHSGAQLEHHHLNGDRLPDACENPYRDPPKSCFAWALLSSWRAVFSPSRGQKRCAGPLSRGDTIRSSCTATRRILSGWIEDTQHSFGGARVRSFHPDRSYLYLGTVNWNVVPGPSFATAQSRPP